MSAIDAAVKAEIEKRAADLALAYADPAKLAAKLAEWIKAKYPERVSSALWISAKGERDRGIAVEIRELTIGQRLKVRVSGLLGGTTAGIAGTADIYERGGVTVSVGAGAVVRYADLRDVAPVAVLTVRF